MKTKLWPYLLVFIAACSPLSPASAIPTKTNLPTFTPDGPTFLPTYTPVAFPTLDPSSYQTPTIPPIHVWLTQDAFATQIRTPVTPVPVMLPKVYEKDGNLYFQKNEDLSIQLTYSGKDRDPILSKDRQKIVFYRGKDYDNVYSINADGSEEKLIIKSSLLPILGQGLITSLTFRSDTHYLSFNTYLCNPREHLYNAPECTVGIYDVNTDTGKIEEFIAGLSGNTLQDRNFEVSPDGKYISVAASGHINIYAGSNLIYQNALVYEITRPDEYLPKQYWLPDSSGLIAVAATNGFNEPGTPPSSFSAYFYELGGTATQILLDNKYITRDGYSMYDYWSVSPDRKWIFFVGNDRGYGKDESLSYIGDLTSGHIQRYEPGIWTTDSLEWGPDSKHFAHTNSIGFIGSVDGSFVPVGGTFIEWIDSTHYYYFTIEGGKPETIKTYIGTIFP